MKCNEPNRVLIDFEIKNKLGLLSLFESKKEFMKKIALIFIFSMFSTAYGQSVSVTKILSLVESRSVDIVSKELFELGFKLEESTVEDGFKIKQFSKHIKSNKESMMISINSELFMTSYKTTQKEAYDILKQKLLTSNFKYAYSYKNNLYYESNSMRIGLNNSANIITLIVSKNK